MLWPILREPYWCAIIALTLNTAAYSSEIIRGGIQAVPFGQIEAARAAGMGRLLALRRIVVPLAYRQALPGYGNELILMIKATSLLSVIAFSELLRTSQLLQAVARDKGGIGYGGAAYGAGAKALAVKETDNGKAIEPTEENVIKGIYPIWRHLFIYVNPALDKGEIADYLAWIRSDEGQKVVKEVGYYPLPENLRNK